MSHVIANEWVEAPSWKPLTTLWMGHVAYKWVMLCINAHEWMEAACWKSHHIPPSELVMLCLYEAFRIWMSHFTCEWVMSQMNAHKWVEATSTKLHSTLWLTDDKSCHMWMNHHVRMSHDVRLTPCADTRVCVCVSVYSSTHTQHIYKASTCLQHANVYGAVPGGELY